MQDRTDNAMNSAEKNLSAPNSPNYGAVGTLIPHSGSLFESLNIRCFAPLLEQSKKYTALQERENFHSLLEKLSKHLPGVIYQFQLNPDGSSSFPYASESIIDIYGITPEQAKLSAEAAFNLIHPDDLPAVSQSIQTSAETLNEWREEYRVKLKDGSIRWLLGHATPQRDDDGSTLWHGYIIDITENKKKEAIFHGVFDQSIFLAGILDSQHRIVQLNKIAKEFYGNVPKVLNGDYFPDTPWWNLQDSRKKLIAALERSQQGFPTQFEAQHMRLNGDIIDVLVSAMPIELPNTTYTSIVGIDITERMRSAHQLEELATHDTLTQLPNRRHLMAQLNESVEHPQRSKPWNGLIFLDLDNFKPLNDTHGHDAGDLLLIEAARRIVESVRSGDTVARFGGDEFVVLLPEIGETREAALASARRIAEDIRLSIRVPFELMKQKGNAATSIQHRCTATLGGTIFSGSGQPAADLIAQADSAMYRAKEKGRDCIQFHLD